MTWNTLKVHWIILIVLIITFNLHLITSFTLNSYSDNEIGSNLNVSGLLFKDFVWSQCGSTDLVKFSRLEVDPDPMVIPGLFSVGMDVLLKGNLSAPLPFSMKMKKKTFGMWIPIPCEHGFGSCDYPDFCALWPYPKPCPEVYKRYGVPCSCPINAGRYNFPESLVGNATLPFDDIPKWLENGHYSIESRLYDTQGNEKFCMQIVMEMKIGS